MKLNLLTVTLLIITSFGVKANDGTPIGRMIRITPTTNACIDKFKEHGQLAESLQRSSAICRYYSWSNKSINRVSWTNYFKCFDKLAPEKDNFTNFPDECALSNSWYLSSSFNTCSSKLKNKFGGGYSQHCKSRTSARAIGSRKFDTCTNTIKNTNITPNRRIEICSSDIGQSEVQCYGKLKTYQKSQQAWSTCTRNRTARLAVLESDFDSSIKSLTALGLTADNAISITTSFDGEEASKCIINSAQAFDVNTLANKCRSYSFRQANQNPNFAKCVVKVESDTITKQDSIDICSVSRDELNLIVNNTSFDKCMVKDFPVTISAIDRYSICTDEDILDLLSTKYYNRCLEKGFKSAILDYFELTAKNKMIYKKVSNFTPINKEYSNTDKITAWTYIFKDCIGDYKYKDKSPKFNQYLKVYRDYNIHTSSIFKKENLQIGGLSALRFDESNKQVYFLSDDRGFNTNASPRIYVYNYDFDNLGELKLSESNIISLSRDKKDLPVQAPKNNFKRNQVKIIKMDMDPEGFDFTKDGNIIISSELDDLFANDFLSLFTPEGKAFETIPLNDEFKPITTSEKKCRQQKKYKPRSRSWSLNFNNTNDEDEEDEKDETVSICSTTYTKKGFAPNESLESLSLTPEKDYLFTGNEDSLFQDQNQNDYGRMGNRVRIVRYNTDINGNFKEEKQYYYRLEKAPENGLVEILALDKDTILTLERSWDNSAKKITSRIFIVNLANAQNILDYTVDTQHRVRSLKKELVIDLADLKYELSPGFRNLDNIEGMSFGPTLPNGKPSIVLVSDNNFRSSQRTMLLVLELNMYELKQLLR